MSRHLHLRRRRASPSSRNRVLAACAGVPLGLAVLASIPDSPAAEAVAPTLRLFPTTVVEDIKHTGDVARELETDLQDVIGRLDQQVKLLSESKCGNDDLDPGCARIRKQLGATYLEMLGTMSSRLPDMERAVDNTQQSLERRLRAELGEKMTPWSLQEMLMGSGGGANDAGQPQPVLRGGSGMRLSDRFRQYYRLVSHPGARDTHSLAVIASDMYLDMRETSRLIVLTQEEISRATLMEELNQSFGAITPQMQEVVDGVKTILFGETGTSVSVAGPPVRTREQIYRSPLQL